MKCVLRVVIQASASHRWVGTAVTCSQHVDVAGRRIEDARGDLPMRCSPGWYGSGNAE
jgi:hypothetical protein